jgi:D-aminopeptidase
VTAVLPHGGNLFREKVIAGIFTANGVGEVVGGTPIREWGAIETPIMLTNSQSIGQVYDTTVRWVLERDPLAGIDDAVMPVVGECATARSTTRAACT